MLMSAADKKQGRETVNVEPSPTKKRTLFFDNGGSSQMLPLPTLPTQQPSPMLPPPMPSPMLLPPMPSPMLPLPMLPPPMLQPMLPLPMLPPLMLQPMLPSPMLPLPMLQPMLPSPMLPPPMPSPMLQPTPPLLFYRAIPWTEDIALEPAAVADVLVQPPAVKNAVYDWIKGRMDGRTPQGGILFLSGPGGCGKRTLVRTVAHTLGAECVEPPALTLEEVYDAIMDISLPLHLGVATKQPRVFLFTGIDGYLSPCDGAAAQTASTLSRILAHFENARNAEAPPVVCTVQGYPGRAGWAIRSSPAVHRLACRRIEPWNTAARAGVSRVLANVCGMARVPNMAAMIMAGFDGDLKQALLRLEFAIRSHSNLRPELTSKDTEVMDAFEAVQLLLTPAKRTPFDNVAEIFQRFTNMETVAHSNYQDELDVWQTATAAAAWSMYATSVFRHPAIACGTLGMELRLARSVPLPKGSMKYEQNSVWFDSRAVMYRQFRDGSPMSTVARQGTVGKPAMTAAPPEFAGSVLLHGISGAECYERLMLLKDIYNATDDVVGFTRSYGVSSRFMSTFTGLEDVEAFRGEGFPTRPPVPTIRKRPRHTPLRNKWTLPPGMTMGQWWDQQVAAALAIPLF